jgi:hypothetical protein
MVFFHEICASSKKDQEQYHFALQRLLILYLCSLKDSGCFATNCKMLLTCTFFLGFILWIGLCKMHGSYIPVVSLVILYWQVLGAQELDVAYIYIYFYIFRL